MKFKIDQTTDGNHGHQLKDIIGGILFGRIARFDLLPVKSKLLDFTGINNLGTAQTLSDSLQLHVCNYTISGPHWEGFEYWNSLKGVVNFHKNRIIKQRKKIVTLNDSVRVHPHQAINFFNRGNINEDIANQLLLELQNAYDCKNPEKIRTTDTIKVATHINRGIDFHNRNSPAHHEHTEPRYFFPIDYYKTIFSLIRNTLAGKKVHFEIYTEQLNSEEILSRFQNDPDVNVIIGQNRDTIKTDDVARIFEAFVRADILVSSNSSFSVTASYFRKGLTIFHPHKHLRELNHKCVPTSVSGEFNPSPLLSLLISDR